MAAVATRNPMRHTGTNGSRSNTPSNARLQGTPSPSLLHFQHPYQQPSESKRVQTPSRLTRASSDPPPDNLKRTSSSAHFDLEPNPFEQSFSGTNIPKNLSDTRSTAAAQDQQQDNQPRPRRARSQSPVGTPSTETGPPAASHPNSSSSRQPVQPYKGFNNRLPPLSALASPSTEALSASYWGIDNHQSLRSGPLSPAMLPGPTASTSGSTAPAPQAFDANSFRTGLTPGTMANPPGPATAALFALMTNATPGGQPPNQFDLNFAQHMQKDEAGGPRRPSPPAATDSSGSNQSMQSRGQPAASTQSSVPPMSEHSYPQSMPPSMAGVQSGQMNTSPPHLSGLPAHMQQHRGGHNPLYLFSQATASDFPGGNEEDLLAVNALRNLNSPQIPGVPNAMSQSSTFAQAVDGLTAAAPSSAALAGHARPPPTSMPQQPSTFSAGGSPLRTAAGQQVSGVNSAPSVPTRGKRKAASNAEPTADATARGTRKRSVAKRTKTDEASDDEMLDSATFDTSMDDAQTVKPLTKEEKKRMSEEDKRKNFLERNRQAALKCRQRKKAWLTELQEKVDLLQSDNETLQGTVSALKDEINMLRSVLVSHKECPVAINNGLNGNVVTTISQVLEGQPS